MVPSPPAATKRVWPRCIRSRTRLGTSRSRVSRITSRPAAEAASCSRESSPGWRRFTPEEGLKNIDPSCSGNIGSQRGVTTAQYSIVREVRMKKVALVAVALQISILSLFAASTPNECTLCVGAVADLQNAPPSPLPLLLQIREDDFATVGASLDAMTPEQRKKVAVLVEHTVTN